MNQRIKSTLNYLPKFIIFGLALLNFLYIDQHSPFRNTGGAISFPHYSPWYWTSDIINIFLILAAAVFLLVGKRWSYLTAAAFSGYIFATGLFQVFFRNMGLLERWEGIQKYERNIFLTIELQWLLSGIVFSVAAFYSIRDAFYKADFEKD
jgi:hypothetical protein